MAKHLYLNFLWHMHQPYYKDDMSGHYSMPWVYLHGIKDYYDMAWYLSTHPGLKATFNLVPSLLIQLKDYETTTVDDRFIQTISKKVEELSNAELLYLMEFLFFAQKETMIDPIARYAELYRKVGNVNSTEQVSVLGHDEILDLEVCFLLAWCGEYLREHSPLIQSLLLKRHFTQDEKRALLEELADFIVQIVPFYKELQDRGQIEISTTPFYHPIMPLLMDVQNAKQADEEVLMPNNPISFSDDAEAHIVRAISYYESVFNRMPRGIWPSEGSVDNDSLERYSAHGIKWSCSDEEILLKSLPTASHDLIYQRCRFKNSSCEIMLSFRDHNISDAIGFMYNRMDPEEAVKDFIHRLRRIYDRAKGSCQVNVVLDGENAWEFYRNNGKLFLEGLYNALDKSDWITTQTMSEAVVNQKIDEVVIETIHPGSWSNGNFSSWIGQEEKNLAWELLYRGKR
ncbi:MAG: glycoside hydrolase family 57 protein, partial [Sulfuricurvum sp.]|nr:glycoside hydrolase family 57 protein [Sulfuricurvum sp.]